MIVVIADDFTGAAEIAGLGLRYGLKVEIESHNFSDSDADLLIIATDTRSLEENDAYDEVYKITKQLNGINYDWVYKKTDSVFRGHIYRELYAMLEANDFQRALLVPANPSLGRKIKNGIYYIGNKYLHETNFSEDPDFALTTSDVKELIHQNNDLMVSIVKSSDQISSSGITIGEAVSETDLNKWARKVDKTILPAGGSGFFTALLEKNGYEIKNSKIGEHNEFGSKFLFVCGSAFSKGKAAFDNTNNCVKKIFPMPESVFNNDEECETSFQNWKQNIIDAFSQIDSVVIEIDQPVVRDKRFSKRLRETMAKLVNELVNSITISELLIDGGATVNSIAQTVGLTKFYPIQELAPGVIRMKVEEVEDLHVTIKPGSYSWPESLLKLPCR